MIIRLIELTEAVEALDTTIEYKTEIISKKEEELVRASMQSSAMDRAGEGVLYALSATDSRHLVHSLFAKVVTLRTRDEHAQQKAATLEVQVAE